ncbi:MAG: DNA helicase RecQ [Parvibaculum sp.]|uniref:DNA helicase RecQ n=1 Tax=Parvibaculum sp. TaxID=2024848 RepID=UPI002844C5D3|nr:DNA helicase RecQ [Parvibaculum sp.]MDR3498728.1 DNA helicase RecQ [Parvibaculum sp.]
MPEFMELKRETMVHPEGVLKDVFGLPSFRGQQGDIIRHVVDGGDAVVLLPTGAGKSLCYQIPALCREGVGIVVSPLIALMRDQVEALRQSGVRAAALNSTLTPEEAQAIRIELAAGRLDLLYVTPERLVSDGFMGLLSRLQPALFAIDEAHCISQWGHDFRPEYLQLAMLKERFPGVPRLALTATADPQTRDDLIHRLQLDDARVFSASFDRPNIRYTIVRKDNAKTQLKEFLRAHKDASGIVYCLSRKKVEETAEWLTAQGIKALPYHAGLDRSVRDANQDAFLKDEGPVLVATIAFGMGIDKPDVRFVAHLDLPSSIEAYYQETGRAGRDGLPSDAWMAYGMGDLTLRRRMIDEAASPEDVKQVERAKLDALLGVCETTACRRQTLLAHFGEHHAGGCGNCDTCLSPSETWDGTEAARKALSAIYRTGQRFGAGHVIDVLRGNKTEKVERFGHDGLPTFGVGKDIDVKGWQSVFRQLAARGIIAADHAAFGALKLEEKARPILQGQEPVEFRRDLAPTGRRRQAKGGDIEISASPEDEALFQALRSERLRLAREQGVPPFVILHDTSLREMARRKPSALDEMTDIPGVGGAKIARYGEAFLAVVAQHG